MPTTLRLVFFGTAELACASLAALAGQPQFEIAGVITQPDRPKGRNLQLQPSPVKSKAAGLGLQVLQPERIKHPEAVAAFSQLRPDLVVVAAYGQLLPAAVLELPRLGCINVHTSLLPKYRGAAPIQWALLNGDGETGVTIMKMDPGLDTGDILTQRAIPIESQDTAQSLHDKLAQVGAQLLVETIPAYADGRILPRKQSEHEASYARKITKQDGQLDWNLPASQLLNRIRAFTPWPGAFTLLLEGTGQSLLKVWEADLAAANHGVPGEVLTADRTGIVVACKDQALRILRLQRQGGRALTAQEFLSGHPLAPGHRFP